MTDKTATQDRRDAPPQPGPDGREASQQPAAVEVKLVPVLRAVNAAIVSARTREELADRICCRVADSPSYRAACLCDQPTLTGQSDNWTVAGAETSELPSPDTLQDDRFATADAEAVTIQSGQTARWTVVPLRYHGTVYGAFGVVSSRTLSDRERTLLRDLGSGIGHAISAIETRRLLAAPAVVEIELVSSDTTHPLVAAANNAECRFTLDGLVSGADAGAVAYLTVEKGSVEAASDKLAEECAGSVEIISETTADERGVLAWSLGGETILGQFRAHGAQVTAAQITSDTARYTAELATSSDVRSLLQCVRQQFPDTHLRRKRELDRAVQPPRLTSDDLASLTDRQRAVLEAAFHAGYYRWPRTATAEEVAATLDISAATLHGHLRKAEHTLFRKLFGTGGTPIRG